MCNRNRTRWLVFAVAAFSLNLLMVRPGFAGPVTRISGSFTSIEPLNGLSLPSFIFRNGFTDEDPLISGLGHRFWDNVEFALGLAETPTSGPVTITQAGMPRLNIETLAMWDVANPGHIDIALDKHSATATVDLTLVQGSEDQSVGDWSPMQNATLVYVFTGIDVDPPGDQLLATWPKPLGASVTGTFSIIGTSVPEPGSFVLACSGAMLFAGFRLLKRQRTA